MQYERQERVPKRVPRIRKLDTLIPTSNRGFAQWNEIVGEPVLPSAILDHLLHHAATVHKRLLPNGLLG
jgi:DNA replication protein DnaC